MRTRTHAGTDSFKLLVKALRQGDGARAEHGSRASFDHRAAAASASSRLRCLTATKSLTKRKHPQGLTSASPAGSRAVVARPRACACVALRAGLRAERMRQRRRRTAIGRSGAAHFNVNLSLGARLCQAMAAARLAARGLTCLRRQLHPGGVGARDVSGLQGRRRWRGPRRQREHGPLSLSPGSHDAAACHCQGPALLAGRERAATAR